MQISQSVGIFLTDKEIQGVSKNVFNKFVKKKVKSNMIKNLSENKKTQSKPMFINCEFMQAEYIQDSKFSTREKQLLFTLRSKTVDVKCIKTIGAFPVACSRKCKVIYCNVLS